MRNFLLAPAAIAAMAAHAQSPTWSEDVACIVYTHCSSCHHEDGPGHFNLMSYADAYYWRADMRTMTQGRFMPPWPPDEEYRSLAHERVLTQAEIDIIAAWVDADAPEGPASEAPTPPTFTNTPVISAPDITAIMDEYVIPSSSSDLYRCFVLDVDNPTDSYITGLEVIPGNTEMVHHVLVYQDTTGEARTLDQADIDPGYTSFGGIGVDEAKLIGIWVPGSEPLFTPSGMGIKLLAGADVVIQIHYPATSEVQLDSTRVNIQLSSGGFVREVSIDPLLDHWFAITDGPLIIPPNEVRTFHSQFTAPFPGTITAIGPHGHLICRSLKAYAVVPGGDTIPLIDIPNWDFRWQGMYPFRNPIHIPTGTVLYGEGTYDNTSANPSNPNDPPEWVFLGEATTDEMMLFYFAWTYGFPSDENIVVDNSVHMDHYLDCPVDFPIGMPETSAPALLEAWPSPAHDVLHVRTAATGGTVRLLDPRGREVMNARAGTDRVPMDVEGLARGLYFVELRSPEGRAVGRLKVVLE